MVALSVIQFCNNFQTNLSFNAYTTLLKDKNCKFSKNHLLHSYLFNLSNFSY